MNFLSKSSASPSTLRRRRSLPHVFRFGLETPFDMRLCALRVPSPPRRRLLLDRNARSLAGGKERGGKTKKPDAERKRGGRAGSAKRSRRSSGRALSTSRLSSLSLSIFLLHLHIDNHSIPLPPQPAPLTVSSALHEKQRRNNNSPPRRRLPLPRLRLGPRRPQGRPQPADDVGGPARGRRRGDGARPDRLPDGRGRGPLRRLLQGDVRPLQEVRRPAAARHADLRERVHGRRHRRGDDGPARRHRGHEHGVPAAGLQPDLEQRRHAPLHVGRAVQGARRHPRAGRRGQAARAPSTRRGSSPTSSRSRACSSWRARPRPTPRRC